MPSFLTELAFGTIRQSWCCWGSCCLLFSIQPTKLSRGVPLAWGARSWLHWWHYNDELVVSIHTFCTLWQNQWQTFPKGFGLKLAKLSLWVIGTWIKKNSIPWFLRTEQTVPFYPRIHSSGYIIVAVALRQSTHIREHISDKAMSIPTSRISMKNLFWWKKLIPQHHILMIKRIMHHFATHRHTTTFLLYYLLISMI